MSAVVLDIGLIIVFFVCNWGKSFLIDFFATWPNMPLCFSAMSSIKVDDIMVPLFGPYTNHHFS